MGMPVQVRRHWTAAQVRELIAAAPLASPRYELVDGELLVTPSPNAHHQGIVFGLFARLQPYCDEQHVGVAGTSPSDVELEAERIAQPDLFVVTTNEWTRVLAEGFPLRTMLLAVEVLSPSSSRYDRVSKQPLYMRHVPEYWIIDPDGRLIERWRAGDARPEIVTQHLEWQPSLSAPSLVIDLPRFFAAALGDPVGPPPRQAPTSAGTIPLRNH